VLGRGESVEEAVLALLNLIGPRGSVR
jgi:hypothetical protein